MKQQLVYRSETADITFLDTSSQAAVPTTFTMRPLEPVMAVEIPFWKRTIDIISALFLLAVFSPVMIASALIIRFVSPGPVFFRQDRVGYKGHIFKLLKFRTMRVGNKTENHKDYMKELIRGECAHEEKPMIKRESANPDIFKFGKFLRVTCLDELPQLFNVLKGDMSLVGPRPCLIYEAKEFLSWHTNRFDILPGITGLWQVSGKNDTTFREMIRLDLRYINSLSLWKDLYIMLKTSTYIMNKILTALLKK